MKHIDLLIKDDSLAVDRDGLPLLVADRDSIVQDLQHAIRESGYLVAMVAERSDERRRLWLQKIILLVEDDSRIVPGTVQMEAAQAGFPGDNGIWTLSADTYDYGSAALTLGVTV